MKHRVNKTNMTNDIILTFSLIIAVSFVKFVMLVTNLNSSEHESAIFFITSFIMIKLIFFGLTRIWKKIKLRLYG